MRGVNLSGKICRGPWWLCWPLVSSAVKAAGVSCTAGLWNCNFPAVCLILADSVFFLFKDLYTSQLCQFLGGVKLGKVLYVYPKSLGMPLVHLTLSFLAVELILAKELPLGYDQRQPGAWGDAGKMRLFFLPTLCIYAQVFGFTMLLRFIK